MRQLGDRAAPVSRRTGSGGVTLGVTRGHRHGRRRRARGGRGAGGGRAQGRVLVEDLGGEDRLHRASCRPSAAVRILRAHRASAAARGSHSAPAHGQTSPVIVGIGRRSRLVGRDRHARDVRGPAGSRPRVAQVGVEALHRAGHDHLGVVVGVGDGVLEQGVHGRDELAAVTHARRRGGGLVQHDLDAALVRRGAHALDGVGHHQVDQHRLARRRLLGLDAGEVEQVVDDAADPEGLVVDAPGQALGHVGVGLGDQRLGQEAQRAHRRLELVAHVGHEVAADLLEPAALRDVLDQRDDAERPAPVVDLAGAHLQRAPGRAVEVEGALGRALVPGVLQDVGHRLGGQGVTVAADHQGVGAPVAVDHRAVLVAQHDALGERVERAAQADGVGARLGHRLGGPAGHLLEVGQRGLDVVLVLGRIEAQAGAEGGEALRDGPPPRAPSEQGGHEADEHAGGHGDRNERTSWVWLRLTSPGPTQRHAPNMTGLGRAGRTGRARTTPLFAVCSLGCCQDPRP